MRLDPECSRCTARIKAQLLPPPWFVAVTVELTMMSPAQWDGELVTDFAPERAVLRKPEMMGVARLTAADQTGLLGDKPHMLAVANAPRLGMAQDGFLDRW